MPPQPPTTTALTPGAQRRITRIDAATGELVVEHVPVFTKKQVQQVIAITAATPYTSPDDELAIEMGLPPSPFYGKTLLEVMVMKQMQRAAQSGEGEEVDRVLDRIIGKPTQHSESVVTRTSYEDRLKAIRAAMAPAAGETRIVEAEVQR